MNYKLLTGCFAGSIIEEGQCILDVTFEDLDNDTQEKIIDFGSLKYPNIFDMEDLKERYELSWDSEETEDEADLKSISQWQVA